VTLTGAPHKVNHKVNQGGTSVPQILGQFCINVRDIERAIAFWDGVIGIPLQSRTEIPGVLEAVLQAPEGGSRMQLAQWLDRDGPIDMGSAMWKLYVNTTDCQALYAKAISAGCESVSEPARLDRWPVTVAFVKDPDGYLLEFVEYHESTPPGVPDPKQSTRL
jgi:lactoylglutathione lyase